MVAFSSGPASALAVTAASSSATDTDQRDLARRPDNTRLLTLTALGVVFGDIGTSPLYTFSVALGAVGQGPPAAANVLGIVSLILWALLVMVSLKYVVFVLRADNGGEGGILALLSLVAPDRLANGGRFSILVLLGVIGAALLYGDGVITPAISVLSAMEGLKLVAPAFADFVLPVTLAIIGRLFGPVMVVWFVVIGVLGFVNVWAAPAILEALDPALALRFVATNPLVAFTVMGAVFLALTGGEALYADMGHVGPSAIRRAWFALVLPALLLNYFGQARWCSPIPPPSTVRSTSWRRAGRSSPWWGWRRWRPSSPRRR
jgi:KUP system potassium uptake protein